MKQEMQRMLEVDALFGEITPEAAKMAKGEGDAAGHLSVVAFTLSSICLAFSAGLLFGGCMSTGAGTGVGGLFFLFGARWLSKEMRKYEAIHLAYLQRDRLRELRGDLEVKPETLRLLAKKKR